MMRTDVAARLEAFIRRHFGIAPDDPHFGRDARLIDHGYVDSIGVAELVAFVEAELGVFIPDAEILSEDFDTIDGIARIVCRLRDRNGVAEHMEIEGD